jgi:hypothetical protein
VSQVFRAIVSVVGDHQRAGAPVFFNQTQYVAIQRLGAIEQQQIDRPRQVAGKAVECIAFGNFNQATDATFYKLMPRQFNLRRFEFASSDRPDERKISSMNITR